MLWLFYSLFHSLILQTLHPLRHTFSLSLFLSLIDSEVSSAPLHCNPQTALLQLIADGSIQFPCSVVTAGTKKKKYEERISRSIFKCYSVAYNPTSIFHFHPTFRRTPAPSRPTCIIFETRTRTRSFFSPPSYSQESNELTQSFLIERLSDSVWERKSWKRLRNEYAESTNQDGVMLIGYSTEQGSGERLMKIKIETYTVKSLLIHSKHIICRLWGAVGSFVSTDFTLSLWAASQMNSK